MKITHLVAALAVLGPATASAANLVVNGGFEDPAIPPGAPYLVDVTPGGWGGRGDVAVQGYAGAVSSGDGSQWFDLNPGVDAGSGISQAISVQAGTTYSFSFLYNGGGGGSTTAIGFLLGFGGQGTLFSGSVSTASMDVYGGTPWARFATTFTPTMTDTVLLFIEPNGAWSGGFIDAVSISAVPEPQTHVLMLAGLGLLGSLARRRARS